MTSPWYKCYPRDLNEGMIGLTLEERGAYITILNLIYARGAPIPEDEWWVTSNLGCTKRVWTKLRAALIVKGKLFAVSYNGVDCLMNTRAAGEIAEREELFEKFSKAGAKGGRNSQAKRNKNKAQGQARLEKLGSHGQAIQNTDTDTEEEPEANASVSVRSAAFDRFWSAYPRKTAKDKARKAFPAALAKCPIETMIAALERQREWEQWRRGVIPHPATWLHGSRWADEDPLQPQPRQAHERSHADAKFAARQANHAAAFEGAQRAAGRDWKP